MWFRLLDYLGIASKNYVNEEVKKIMEYNMETRHSLEGIRQDIQVIIADLDRKQDALGK